MFVINLRHLFICAVRTALKNTALENKLALWSVQRVTHFPEWGPAGVGWDMPAGMGGICAPPSLFFLSFKKKFSFGHILVSLGKRYEANNRESFLLCLLYILNT